MWSQATPSIVARVVRVILGWTEGCGSDKRRSLKKRPPVWIFIRRVNDKNRLVLTWLSSISP